MYGMSVCASLNGITIKRKNNMKKIFLTQQEKIFLRNMKNRGKSLSPEARKNMFGLYNPYFNYKTNKVDK